MVFVKLPGQAGNLTNKSGNFDTGPRPIPAGVGGATLRIDCTTGNPATPFAGIANPFNDPADIIILTTFLSWDGGVTFPDSASTHANGSPTGIWGKSDMAPMLSRSLPDPSELHPNPPTHYRGVVSIVGGPITCGFSIEEYPPD
jgi:hypothetical protein